MSKGRKKSAKHTVDWNTIIASAIADLIVGIILALVAKLFK